MHFNIQYNSYDVAKIIPVDLTIRESFSIFYFIKSQSMMQRFFRKSATCYCILRMKKFRTNVRNFSCGDPSGIRTPDTLLKRQVLYLLS